MSAETIAAVERYLERTHRCRAELSDEVRQRLRMLQAWQAQRLAGTYADLRREPRYRAAVEFFLGDLYGPQGFDERDRAFERAWHVLRRRLPEVMLEVVAAVAELQALTAELDTAMATRLAPGEITPSSYLAAYRAGGSPAPRARQIDLIIDIGARLARAVQLRWVGWALRAAHTPAHVAGLAALQSFLERGYAAFRALGDSRVFLGAIAEREGRLMRTLCSGSDAEALQLLRSGQQPAGELGRKVRQDA